MNIGRVNEDIRNTAGQNDKIPEMKNGAGSTMDVPHLDIPGDTSENNFFFQKFKNTKHSTISEKKKIKENSNKF